MDALLTETNWKAKGLPLCLIEEKPKAGDKKLHALCKTSPGDIAQNLETPSSRPGTPAAPDLWRPARGSPARWRGAMPAPICPQLQLQKGPQR